MKIQTIISWLELGGFVVAIIIAGIIWRVGKRDSENKNSKSSNP